ncbi:hypothetical protein ACFE04_010243 [Oxalis oulophora]
MAREEMGSGSRTNNLTLGEGKCLLKAQMTDSRTLSSPSQHTSSRLLAILRLSPTFDLEWKQSKQNNEKIITQLWQFSESCPDGTVPIRRTKKSDILRVFSFVNKNLSINGKQFSQVTYEEAVAYVHGGKYFGAKGTMDIWNPRVQKDEFSKCLISVMDSEVMSDNNNYRNTNLDIVVVVLLLPNNGHKTVCYNLHCPGFVLVSKHIALGSSSKPYSTFDGSSHWAYKFTIRQDHVTGDWWLLSKKEQNNNYHSKHTTTQIGSGRFSNEGFGKANMISDMFIFDEHNKAQRPSLVDHMTHSGCYDIKHLPSDHSSGMNLYFGGPRKTINRWQQWRTEERRLLVVAESWRLSRGWSWWLGKGKAAGRSVVLIV